MRNEPERWMLRSVREAAWAPLLVLGAVGVAAAGLDLYTRWPWLDMPTHFVGGIAVTYFFWRAGAHAPWFARRHANAGRALVALAGTASMALLWEAFEFVADRFLGGHMQHGLMDTAADIILGLAGGVAYLALRSWFTAQTERPGSD